MGILAWIGVQPESGDQEEFSYGDPSPVPRFPFPDPWSLSSQLRDSAGLPKRVTGFPLAAFASGRKATSGREFRCAREYSPGLRARQAGVWVQDM